MPDQAVRPGAQLLEKLDNAELPAGVRVHGVDCLSNCKNGCTIVLQAAARWTYIYGNINPESELEQLCEGITGYSHSEDGIVPWKQRVALFRKTAWPVFRLKQEQTDRQPKTAKMEQYRSTKKDV